MSNAWKQKLSKASTSFKARKYQEAVDFLTEAIKCGGEKQFVVYDSRAAASEKLGKRRDALRDAKTAINIDPSRWQGYSRAARIFLSASRYDEALKMADMAISRVNTVDKKRYDELAALKRDILEGARRFGYHFGRLPLEVCGEIFQILVSNNSSNIYPLLRVSRSWNSIVWNTASLWSTLSLRVRKPGWKAKRWIERSKGVITHLTLPAELAKIGWSFGHLHGLHWNRLESCSLENSSLGRFLTEQELIGTLTDLQELQLIHYDSNWSDIISLFQARAERVKLSSLHVRNSPLPWDALLAETSLKSLILDAPAFSKEHTFDDGLLLTLKGASDLQSLIVKSCARSDLVDEYETCQLSSLECFHWENSDTPYQVLRHIRAPALRRVRFATLRSTLDQAFGELASSELQALQELAIDNCLVLAPQCVIDCLQLATSLQTLVLTRVTTVVGPILELLASKPELCPELLHLDVSHCMDVKSGPIVRLVKSRTVVTEEEDSGLPESKIRALFMNGCPLIEAEILPWLRQKVKTVSCIYMTKKEAGYRR